jgi:hypothetical protein
LGDASPSTEDASPVPSSQVQSNLVGLTGAYFRSPASPPFSQPRACPHLRPHDRPSTLPIPRGCLLTPCGSGPVVSLHARARTLFPTRTRTRTPCRTRTRTARTLARTSSSTCDSSHRRLRWTHPTLTSPPLFKGFISGTGWPATKGGLPSQTHGKSEFWPSNLMLQLNLHSSLT